MDLPGPADEKFVRYPWQVKMEEDVIARWEQLCAWNAYVRASESASPALRSAWRSVLREHAYSLLAWLIDHMRTVSTEQIIVLRNQLRSAIKDAT